MGTGGAATNLEGDQEDRHCRGKVRGWPHCHRVVRETQARGGRHSAMRDQSGNSVGCSINKEELSGFYWGVKGEGAMAPGGVTVMGV